MINWKVVIGSGAVAVVLSLLTGVISGVSFGTLLLRALMWGVIFCGVGSGVSYVISKYLPELFSSSASGRTKETAEQPNNVDIVLPDENPHVAEDADFGGDAEREAQQESFNFADSGEAPPSRAERFGGELVEEVEEVESDDALRGSERRPPGGSDEDSADELPTLEGDATDFSTPDEQGRVGSAGVSDISNISGRGSTVDILGHEADTEEIAKAIRTALKKDQKG